MIFDKGLVEAALFSASGPLHLRDLAEKIGLSEESAYDAAESLIDDYNRREGAIQIIKTGKEYLMQLREEYTHVAGKTSDGEITKGTMKTLVTIAYNQPLMQSELFKNLGARVYDDVRTLVDMGLVSKKRVGQSAELTTTKKFSEYFGIGSTKKEDIRAWIDKKQR